MGTFLRSTEIKATRKVRRCFACNEIIHKGNKVVEWVAVSDGSVSSVYLHPECWDITTKFCFGCNNCDDGEGFQEGYIKESMNEGSRCEGVDQWYPFWLSLHSEVERIEKELKEAIKI
jgi:hypothetical protein